MTIKSPAYEVKVPRGVGLKQSLWDRIDAYARQQRKTRPQVIEEVLNTYIPMAPDLQNPQEKMENPHATLAFKEVQDDDD